VHAHGMPLTVGLKYVVVIVATNTGGPPLDVSGSTLPMLVDASPPKPKFVRLVALDPGRGLHSSTFQLILNRF